MRYFYAIILTAGVAAGLFGWPAAGAERADAIAAIVNDSIITARDVEMQAGQSILGLQQTYRKHPEGYDPEAYKQKVNALLEEGLNQLVEKQLILSEYTSGKLKVPQRVIDDEIERQIRKDFGDRLRLMQQLKNQGLTYDTWRQQLQDRIIVTIMNQHNVSSALLISPQKIEQFYTTNQARFQLEDQVKLRMIVINAAGGAGEQSLALAQEILSKIEEGASFAEMASIYSEGSTRREGGDWGWVESKKNAKGLSEVAFSLQPGQHSPVLGFANDAREETYWVYQYDKAGRVTVARKYPQRGVMLEEKKIEPGSTNAPALPPNTFYLMLVEDKRPARTRPLSEVREEIEGELTLKERDRLQKQWIEKLKAKAFIQTY